MTKAAKKIEKRNDVMPPAGKKKYGDVKFADATNNKYPIDSAKHVRAAWSYIHHKDNAEKYDKDEVELIKNRIKRAAEKFDVKIEDD